MQEEHITVSWCVADGADGYSLFRGDVVSWPQRRPRWQRWLSFFWRPWRSDRTVFKRILDVESDTTMRIGKPPKTSRQTASSSR